MSTLKFIATKQMLVEACTGPWEVIQCPYFTVSVFGVCGSKRITTNRVVIKVERCGYAAGETPKDPTPTVYETMISNIEAVNTTVEQVHTDVEQIHAEMGDIGTALDTIIGGAPQ